MFTMRILLIVLSLLTNFFLYGQVNSPGKTAVLEVIKQGIHQKPGYKNGNSCENGLCGEWFTKNRDSSFYKDDTLKIYNSSNIMYDTNHYCYFKIWEFARSNKFSQHGIEICHEPPVSTMEASFSMEFFTGNNKWKRIPIAPENYKVVQKDNVAFIILYTGQKVFGKYKVTDISGYNTAAFGDKSFVITLVRQPLK